MGFTSMIFLGVLAIQFASYGITTDAFIPGPRSSLPTSPRITSKSLQLIRAYSQKNAQTLSSSDAESSVLNGTPGNVTESSIPLPQPPHKPSSSNKNKNKTPDAANKNALPRSKRPPLRTTRTKRKMELAWCNHGNCQNVIREKVVGEHNHMELTGPATGQVAYSWEQYSMESVVEEEIELGKCKFNVGKNNATSTPAVLILVKREDDELTKVAVEAITELVGYGVQVLVDETLAGELGEYDHVDLESDLIRLFEPRPVPGFGTGEELQQAIEKGGANSAYGIHDVDVCYEEEEEEFVEQPCPADLSDADLIVTLGGDGLLMYASQVFSGPVPPILPVAGGSMGFLTPFQREEMVEAVLISLGLRHVNSETRNEDSSAETCSAMCADSIGAKQTHIVPTKFNSQQSLAFGKNNKICISMRMRLDCRIFNADGSLKSRYNVLNEVVIDRGSSPYLASLECYCDDVHLTTVQADGIIFSTPTGSTAYSMAAGGSVVHPAVPAILVTPICPHVLSFRSMVFPDHVVLRCYVPEDARSTACVYFDGKHRTELHRGDSVQIEMSAHPVPTINRADHSSDWLSSLKRNFNFNTRVRQNPLR
mmetsp:Transcript_5303/g.9795  ORF Transcript_5303/g.9795 Transcript_5303/m.9795 type:complete len:595 (+) Transcript_5303:231-2015(+)